MPKWPNGRCRRRTRRYPCGASCARARRQRGRPSARAGGAVTVHRWICGRSSGSLLCWSRPGQCGRGWRGRCGHRPRRSSRSRRPGDGGGSRRAAHRGPRCFRCTSASPPGLHPPSTTSRLLSHFRWSIGYSVSSASSRSRRYAATSGLPRSRSCCSRARAAAACGCEEPVGWARARSESGSTASGSPTARTASRATGHARPEGAEAVGPDVLVHVPVASPASSPRRPRNQRVQHEPFRATAAARSARAGRLSRSWSK